MSWSIDETRNSRNFRKPEAHYGPIMGPAAHAKLDDDFSKFVALSLVRYSAYQGIPCHSPKPIQ